MIDRVIFLLHSPLNGRDFDRFGIDILQQHGFNVETWDASHLLWPTVQPSDQPLHFEGERRFRDLGAVRRELSRLPRSSFVIPLFTAAENFGTLRVFRTLSASAARYGLTQLAALPTTPQLSHGRRLERAVQDPSWLITRSIFRAALACSPLRPPDLLLVSAGGALRGIQVHPETEVLWTHSLDYDLFRQLRSSHGVPRLDCGIFLDEYNAYHPDFRRLGIPTPVTAERYYPALCRFFDRLEREQHCRIEIAAHPVSDYRDADPRFGGRVIHRGRTMAQVAESAFVLAHCSTSILHAVLWRKPAIFFKTGEMKGTAYESTIDAMASLLNKTPWWAEQDVEMDWTEAMRVDETAYRTAQNDYIKREGSEDRPCWEIVARRLQAYGREVSTPASRSRPLVNSL